MLSWELYAALACVVVAAGLLGGDEAGKLALMSTIGVGFAHLAISTSPRVEYWLACADEYVRQRPPRLRVIVVAGTLALLTTWFVLPVYSGAAFPDVLFETGNLSWHFTATISGDTVFSGPWSYVCWPLVAAMQCAVLCTVGGLLAWEVRRERYRRVLDVPAASQEPVTFRS